LTALGENTAVALILAKRPIVELFAPDTQWLIRGRLGGSEESIERHADVERDLGHRISFAWALRSHH
jgi:hypothetical protein